MPVVVGPHEGVDSSVAVLGDWPGVALIGVADPDVQFRLVCQ